MVVGSGPVVVIEASVVMLVTSKEFKIRAAAECRFTLKCICDMIRTRSEVVYLIFNGMQGNTRFLFKAWQAIKP